MSEVLLKRLHDSFIEENVKSRALLDEAETRGGMTAEESAKFDESTARMLDIKSRKASIEAGMAASKDIEESFRSLPVQNAGPANDLDVAVREFITGTRNTVDIPWHEKRDLTVTTTAGGYLIPTQTGATLREHLVEASGLLQSGVTVINTAGGGPLDLPYTTSHGAAAAVAINTGFAESDPAFAKRTLSSFKYAQLLQAPTELLQDEVFDVLGYIARSMGRNLGLAIGPKFITGAGTTEPTGIVTSATLGKTGSTAVAGVFTADDLIDLYFSVIAPFRNSPAAGWLMRDASLGTARKLKDSAGQYLFTPGLTYGEPDSLLGKPVFTDPTVAATAIAAKSVVFGDLSQYWVRFAGPIRFERSDDYAFNSDQVTFRAAVRTDGLLVDQTGSVKYFAGGAS